LPLSIDRHRSRSLMPMQLRRFLSRYLPAAMLRNPRARPPSR
jgi:hypothetical protein